MISMYEQERNVLMGLSTKKVEGIITTYTPVSQSLSERRVLSYNNTNGKALGRAAASTAEPQLNTTIGFYA